MCASCRAPVSGCRRGIPGSLCAHLLAADVVRSGCVQVCGVTDYRQVGIVVAV